MKKGLIAAAIVGLAGSSFSSGILACGDKFLVLSRGTRFERPGAASRTASVLVYTNPSSQLPQGLAGLSIEATLRKAGYRPFLVSSSSALDQALSQRKWDVVVVDIADGPAVSGQLQGTDQPAVLPVLYKPAAPAFAEARRRYRHALKAPANNRSLLEAIDVALAVRTAAREKAEKSTAR
jgi:hypothetical protein